MAKLRTVTLALLGMSLALVAGCHELQTALTSAGPVPAPLQREGPVAIPPGHKYDETVTGAHLFDRHCATCHNPRPLSERPFFSYKPVLTHMRTVAVLTGEEHRKILDFLRHWHDMPPPHPPVEPSPKRFFFAQPIPELQETAPVPRVLPQPPAAAPAGPPKE